MGNMITIVSRKKFHFRNPDPAVDIMRMDVNTAATKNRDRYKDAVFISCGDARELQQAPDWINKPLGPDNTKNGADKNGANLLTWKHAVEDGDLYQVNVIDAVKGVNALGVNADEQQAQQ